MYKSWHFFINPSITLSWVFWSLTLSTGKGTIYIHLINKFRMITVWGKFGTSCIFINTVLIARVSWIGNSGTFHLWISLLQCSICGVMIFIKGKLEQGNMVMYKEYHTFGLNNKLRKSTLTYKTDSVMTNGYLDFM